MKKRVSALLLMTALTATLVMGCSNNGTNDSPAEETTEETAKENEGDSDKFVGMTVPSVANDFMLALTGMMQETLEGEGTKVQLDSAENDVTTQIEQIENYVSMGCDIIVVWAVNGEGVASACQKAQDAGIPVLAFAYEVPGADSSVISATEESMAAQCVAMAEEWIDETFADAGDGEVNVLVVRASSTPETVIRSDGLEEIGNNSKVTMTIVESPDQNKTEVGRDLAENTFSTNADYDVVLCINGTTAIGFESYFESSASPITDKSKFALFCVDETEEVVAKIKASATDESVLRGTVSLGSLGDTVNDFMKAMTPLLNDQEPIHVTGSAKPITADDIE